MKAKKDFILSLVSVQGDFYGRQTAMNNISFVRHEYF